MRKDDHGVAPYGGIFLGDAARAVSADAARTSPAAAPGTATGTAAEGGSAITKPSGGTAGPVAESGPPGVGSGSSGAQDGRRGSGPPRGAERPANVTPGPGAAATPGPGAAAEAGTYPGPRVPRSVSHPEQEKDAGPEASVAVRSSGGVVRPAPDTSEPSLARVLATTIRLWVTRRLRRLGIGRRPRYAGTGTAGRAPAAPGRSRSAVRWRVVAIVLAAAIVALVALQLSGALNKPAPSHETAANPGNGGASSLSAAAAARNQAAAWVAQQVGRENIIACDPVVCSALLGRGIPAGRLLPLQSAGANPFGADVIVASPSVRSEYGSDLTTSYAPMLIASFGSGASRVDLRAVALQGGPAYRAGKQPDLTARKLAGAQLLHNPRVHASAQAAREMTAGQVDARLLVTLASLAAQRAVDVGSFSDTGPGAPVAFRQVTVTSPGGKDAALTADLDQVRTQRAPYLPDSATIVHPGGPAVLRIEFGAPSPQGLLSGGNSS